MSVYEAEFRIDRGHIEPGATFSREVIEAVVHQFDVFLMTRIGDAWGERNEPPTHAVIKIEVELA